MRTWTRSRNNALKGLHLLYLNTALGKPLHPCLGPLHPCLGRWIQSNPSPKDWDVHRLCQTPLDQLPFPKEIYTGIAIIILTIHIIITDFVFIVTVSATATSSLPLTSSAVTSSVTAHHHHHEWCRFSTQEIFFYASCYLNSCLWASFQHITLSIKFCYICIKVVYSLIQIHYNAILYWNLNIA